MTEGRAHREPSPHPHQVDQQQFNEARERCKVLLHTLDQAAQAEGRGIHHPLYGPFRAVCVDVTQMNRMLNIYLHHCKTVIELMETSAHIQRAIEHLPELIQAAHAIAIHNPSATDVHREIVQQAQVVQQNFPSWILYPHESTPLPSLLRRSSADSRSADADHGDTPTEEVNPPSETIQS